MKQWKYVAILVLCPAFAWAQGGPAPAIDGEWSGSIAGKLRVILRVDKPAGDGSVKALLESIDQGNAKIPMDVTPKGAGSYRFDINKIGAVYDAKISSDGSELEGIFEQGSARIPLVLKRAGSAATQPKAVTIGSVHFESCTAADGATGALCGTYEVYENRDTRQGRKIALNITILPAQTAKPEPDPVFAFAGGPGESATAAFPFASFVRALRDQRDVVLIDQRGTGKSNPLHCKADPKDIQALLNDPYPAEMLSKCRVELEKHADLTQYTTTYAIDDFDDVRAALGFPKINVLGGSYGSLAALIYLRRHGDHVRSVAVEAVAPPDYRLPLAFGKTIQSSIEHLFTNCAADPVCTKEFPHLKDEFEATLKRLDKEPAKFELRPTRNEEAQTVTLSRGAYVTSLRSLLYQPLVVIQLPYILHSAYENDWKPYAETVVTLNRAVGGVVARGMSYSVTCAESVPFITEADIRRDTGGTYLGDFDVRRYQKKCADWPHATVSKDVLAPVQSDVPVLLIAGAEDPATPTWMAERAAEKLSHARVVGIPNGTHLSSTACTDQMIAGFIRAGSEKAVDSACVAQIKRTPFLTSERVKQLKALAGQ